MLILGKKYFLVFYDFEVYKEDWIVTFIDYNSRRIKTIVNNTNELIKLYNKLHDNTIFLGFNNRGYDNVIFKSLLLGMNPKDVNDSIIKDGKKEFQISKRFINKPLISYDTMVDRNSSLKQLEGFMGEMIKETDVPFDIDRKLTKNEVKEVIKYNIHDVEQTIKVFEELYSDFEAHVGLIEEFNLDISSLIKTKAKLSAMILGAERMHGLNDEMEYEFPDTLELGKYEHVKEHFDKNRFLTYVNDKGVTKKNQLETEIYGLKTIYGYGGLHSAIPKYYTDNSDGSIIVHSDVALT